MPRQESILKTVDRCFTCAHFFLQRTVGKELKMEHIFWEAVEENPIIAAVKNMEDLEKCCSLSDIHVVFILFGDICSIADIVQRLKKRVRLR